MSGSPGGVLAVFLAAVTAFAPLGTALAQKPPPPKSARQRLAVIDVSAGEGLAGIAAKITRELAAAAEKDGTYEVLDPGKVRTAVGVEGLKALQSCKGQPACLAEKGVVLQGARVVTGDLQRDEDSYLVKLWLVDITAGATVSKVERDILIASRRLEKDVAESIPALIRGEAEATGFARITMESGATGATVTIDGVQAGVTPLDYGSKPGKHSLKVEHPAYYPAERFFTISAGETTEVSVAMVPLPKVAAPPPAVARADEGPGTNYLKPVGIGLGAAGLILFVAGVAIGAGVSSTESDAKKGPDGVLGITRQEAIDADSSAGTANVLLIVGAVALAGGGVLAALGFMQDDRAADASR